MPENFGDILNKWEGFKNHNGRTQKNNEMDAWLQKNEVFDKDAVMKNENIPGEGRRRLINAKPDDILDIHGLTRDEALVSLDHFFTRAKDNGYKKLRIIHGKGNHSQGEAVLSNIVRDFIEKCRFAGENGYEKASNGGTGATWVLLK